MPVALKRAKFWLAAGLAFAALAAAVIQPKAANASTSPYCGGNKAGWEACTGGIRWLYQTYGWGDQGSVCVTVVGYPVYACSSSAGSGVYSGNVGSNVYAYPYIRNNTPGSNYVHGVALTH